MIGKRLGCYEIIRELGRGGMGAVYLARDHSLERTVAVKVIPEDLVRDTRSLDRFRKEARAAARLQHPAIVGIHGLSEEGGVCFFVMEYLEGESLEKILDREGKLPPDEALKITSRIASALDHAHRRGIVHRDIKPGNIILNRETGLVKVTDFGIARALEADDGRTEPEFRVGTPRYMSPEQVRGEELDGRSDIFSLGAVLFRMLSGKDPFEGESFLTVMRKIIEERPELPENFVRDSPPGIKTVLDRALAKDPARRFRNGREMAGAIDRLLAGESPPVRRKKSLLPLIAAGAGLILAAAAVFILRSPVPRPAPDGEDAEAAPIPTEPAAVSSPAARPSLPPPPDPAKPSRRPRRELPERARSGSDLPPAVRELVEKEPGPPARRGAPTEAEKLDRALALARRSAETDQPVLAVSHYDEVLQIDPEHPEALAEKQALLEYLEENRDSETAFRQLQQRGLALLQAGEPERAAAELEKAARIKPRHPQVQELLRAARREAAGREQPDSTE